jgi:hypothetical protein
MVDGSVSVFVCAATVAGETQVSTNRSCCALTKLEETMQIEKEIDNDKRYREYFFMLQSNGTTY